MNIWSIDSRDPGTLGCESGMSSPGLFSGRCPLRRWYRRSTRCSWTVKTRVIAPASRCTWMATCWTTFQSCAASRGCRRARCYAWWKVCLETGQPAKGGHPEAGPGSAPLTLAGHRERVEAPEASVCGGSTGAQPASQAVTCTPSASVVIENRIPTKGLISVQSDSIEIKLNLSGN